MRVLISLSGGMDSAVLLALTLNEGHRVVGVFFDYGSKHWLYEREAAEKLADHYSVPFVTQNIHGVFTASNSALLLQGPEIPEGHYEAESMKQTVVPGRNTTFAAILLGIAQGSGFDIVRLGIHAGDHHIYPDCRPEWLQVMNRVYHYASEDTVELQAPFLHMTKADIVRKGLTLGVPFEKTRTCYKQQPVACGKCGSCTERMEAFKLNGVIDPVEYAKL